MNEENKSSTQEATSEGETIGLRTGNRKGERAKGSTRFDVSKDGRGRTNDGGS